MAEAKKNRRGSLLICARSSRLLQREGGAGVDAAVRLRRAVGSKKTAVRWAEDLTVGLSFKHAKVIYRNEWSKSCALCGQTVFEMGGRQRSVG